MLKLITIKSIQKHFQNTELYNLNATQQCRTTMPSVKCQLVCHVRKNAPLMEMNVNNSCFAHAFIFQSFQIYVDTWVTDIALSIII